MRASKVADNTIEVKLLASGNHNTNSTSLSIAVSEKVEPNCMLVLFAMFDNSGTSGADPYSSIGDVAANTWTRRENFHYDPGNANEGFSGGIFTAGGGTTLLGDPQTITITLSPAATAKAYVLYKVRCLNGQTPSYHSSGMGTSVLSGTSATVTSANLEQHQVVFGFAVAEGYAITGDSDTTRGSWSTADTAIAGAGLTGMAVAGQYKHLLPPVPDAIPTQTYNVTVSTNCSMRCGWVAIEAYDAPLAHAFMDNTTASGVGSGSVVSSSVAITPVGGGTPTYAWEYVSGDTLTIDSPSSSSTTFSYATLTATRVGVYRCKVTDTKGGTYYGSNVTITLTYSNNVNIDVYAAKTDVTVNDTDVQYRVNGGSWITINTCTSTSCFYMGQFTITSGDSVDIRMGDNSFFQYIEGANDCANAITSTDLYAIGSVTTNKQYSLKLAGFI